MLTPLLFIAGVTGITTLDSDGFYILEKNKKTHRVLVSPRLPCPDGLQNVNGEGDGWKIRFKVTSHNVNASLYIVIYPPDFIQNAKSTGNVFVTVRNLDFDSDGSNCDETYLLLSGFNSAGLDFRTICGNEETAFRGEITNARTFSLEVFAGNEPLRGFELIVKAVG